MKAKIFALIAIVCCLQNTFASSPKARPTITDDTVKFVGDQVADLAIAASASILKNVLQNMSKDFSTKKDSVTKQKYGKSAKVLINDVCEDKGYLYACAQDVATRRVTIIGILGKKANSRSVASKVFVNPDDLQTFLLENRSLAEQDGKRLGAALLALQALAPATK